jgi:arylsulfatase A-like enzyme
MSKFSRRDFLSGVAALMGAGLGSGLLAGCSTNESFSFTNPGPSTPARRPNILLVLSDEFSLPPRYPEGTGMPEDIRKILGFEQGLDLNSQFAQLFPGFTRLRQNAVAFRTHYTASAACVPSRATMLTGQYPTVHGVSQTTGFFKDASDPGFVFLDPDGVPTVGDWFQAAGYETYYFGKWHVSEACDDLGPWGFPFAKWDGPEPHGSDVANLGVYRDVEFANNTIDFLNSKGGDNANSSPPWFAVTSYLAPHDISGWPLQWFEPGGNGVQDFVPLVNPPAIPGPGTISLPGISTATTPTDCPPPLSPPRELNPGGYPAGVYNPVPTLNEDLTTKPDCQYDMSIKIGLCQKSIIPAGVGRAVAPNPFQLTGNRFEEWATAYGEWWTYQHYLLDIQFDRVFKSLDQNGLRDNTIVIFTTDHGDYAGAHGGMVQKWHTAYEEAIHVPFLVSSPLVNPSNELKEFRMPTSHIDLLPTLLGLAGFDAAEQENIRQRIQGQGTVPVPVGTDISDYVYDPSLTTPIPNAATGEPRPGALFMTLDEISQMTSIDPNNKGFGAYQDFLGLVNEAKVVLPRLVEGPIRQPNLVRTLLDGTWKYSRYYDPNGVEPDQYELYHINTDPIEAVNLLDFRTGQVRPDVSVPGVSPAELEANRVRLASQLAQQEALLL